MKKSSKKAENFFYQASFVYKLARDAYKAETTPKTEKKNKKKKNKIKEIAKNYV